MSPPDIDRIAIVAVSRPGAALARRLATSLTDAALYLERRTAGGASDDDGATQLYDLPLRPVIQDLFARHRALVVLLPVGATVRLLAPVLGSKRQDPAVVCVDDAGRYAVSLLSGHVGGADALARRVETAIGAQAIVTSASDALDVAAIDLVGRDLGWKIEATPTDLTRAAAAVVNGEPVALWLDPETGVRWPDDVPISESISAVSDLSDAKAARYAAALVVSDRVLSLETGRPVVIYRPPTLVAGMGCRRGVSEDHLRELLDDTLRQNGLAAQSLAKIATADIKADEAGVLTLAPSLGVPLEIYSADELNSVAERQPKPEGNGRELSVPTASAAQNLLGVFGVSEPAAMLAANADGVIVPRTKSDRATIAVARITSASGNPTEAVAMKQPETMMPGEALLAEAERQIALGNYHKGSGLVWQATMAALSAVAGRHGMPCRNREEARLVARHLDSLANSTARRDDLARYRNYLAFGTADSFREHNEDLHELVYTELLWEPDEYAIHLDSMHGWIESLHRQLKGDKTV